MIDSAEGLEQAQYWATRLERSLEGLRQRVQPINEQKYRIMAEGFISQIRQLREEIDEYLTLQALGEYRSENNSQGIGEDLGIVSFEKQPTLRPQVAVR